MAGIEIVDLKKSYDVEKRELPVLTGINLKIPEKQITVILGRSGCGKTTLLKAMARQLPLREGGGRLRGCGGGPCGMI